MSQKPQVLDSAESTFTLDGMQQHILITSHKVSHRKELPEPFLKVQIIIRVNVFKTGKIF